MHGAGQFLGQDLVDLALAGHPAQPLESLRDDGDIEMRLSAGLMTGMPLVLLGLVHYFQRNRMEFGGDFTLNAVSDAHDGLQKCRTTSLDEEADPGLNKQYSYLYYRYMELGSFLLSAKDKSRGFSSWEAGWKSDPGLRVCERPGCEALGQHRAPKSRDRLDDYYWFCVDHVRDYNASWNFFDGMKPEDIHRFQHDNAFWHRPTWRFSDRVVKGAEARQAEPEIHVHDPFDFFDGRMGNARPQFRERRDGSLKPLDGQELKALSALGLDGRATGDDIKAAYKRLVKKFHPDKTGGNKALEARFREVTTAYQYCVKAGFC